MLEMINIKSMRWLCLNSIEKGRVGATTVQNRRYRYNLKDIFSIISKLQNMYNTLSQISSVTELVE